NWGGRRIIENNTNTDECADDCNSGSGGPARYPCESVPGRAPGAAVAVICALVGVWFVFEEAATSPVLFCPNTSHSTRPSTPANTPRAAPASNHWPAPKPFRADGL